MRRVGGTVVIGATLGVMLLLPFATDHAFAQQEIHREAIDNAYREWVDATNAKDLDRWASFLAPDPLFLPPNHPALRGEMEIRDFYARLFVDSRFSLSCRQQQVKVAEAQDMAWSTGSCDAVFTGSDGDAARGSSKWTKVWIRQPNGDWKCALNSWNMNGPSAQTTSPYLPAGSGSGLPLVQPNDNRVPAGTLQNGVLDIGLEVLRADWRLETPLGPGLRVAAVAEEGGAPTIPAPLIRVETGTRIRMRVRNRLDGAPITVFGLHTRPAEDADPFEVDPGEERTLEFEAGTPGTYLYWIREGPEPDPESKEAEFEQEQLAGAFVVDPAGGSPPDRVLVMNIFSEAADETVSPTGWVEGFTINGRSWPFTERMALSVGDEVRWRVVNASTRNHPMHLHGFFYSVLSRGTATADTIYSPDDRRLVVTESMRPRTTMTMEWTPTRPGRWLFHCHLSFHVTSDIRLPGAAEADPEHAHSHMAGLVIGIEVAPGPSDLVSRGPPIELDLYANEYGDRTGYRYGFAVDPDFVADSLTDVPGPLLVFNQFQTVNATVHNRTTVPTGVHWHGLELDGWADGVPDWSASDGRVSPAIAPGDSFTYRLSLMRPGTFIYHSHLDDIHQLSGGLYGPLVVLPEGERFDPRTDHAMVWGWNHPDGAGMDQRDLNGRHDQPDATGQVGEEHRFRVINIAPADRISAWITIDGDVVPITLHAKDGADLPPNQQIPVDRLPRLGVGETADFTWTPTAPGTYELHVGFAPEPGANLVQRWVVRER